MSTDKPKTLKLVGLRHIPRIKEGSNLSLLILKSARRQLFPIKNNDIVVITQKIISKSERRLVDLRSIHPSSEAIKISQLVEKTPQLVQLILDESKEVLRVRKGVIIVKHRLGFVCANAGIDHSNTVEHDPDSNYVLLLPKDPDKSARQIQVEIEKATGKQVGVLIIDSHGRAWRNGTVGTTIGAAGLPGLVDLRGKQDLFGYTLKATQVAASDELAAAASLLMGQADEAIPCVIARGFPYPLREFHLNELIRPDEEDLFN